MPGRFSDLQVEDWLRDFGICWVAAHYDDPDTAGAYASEVFGGSYARCKVSFSEPSNRAILNVSVISFAGLPPTRLSHLAFWDAPINGNYRASAPLPQPIRVISGGRLDLGVGKIALSFE